MDVTLWILGLLKRFGPLHGYQIKKVISEEIADFARIKLPLIYYHLKRMEAEGLLAAESEKDSGRPERRVYSLAREGEVALADALVGLLSITYEPSFSSDALLYFADAFEPGEIELALEAHAAAMRRAGESIARYEADGLAHVHDQARIWATCIFEHHKRHYEAEADWAEAARALIIGAGNKEP